MTRAQFFQSFEWGIKTTYHLVPDFQVFKLPGFFRQDRQESNHRLCLPKCAEDRFFKAPTCASKIHGAPLAVDEDKLAGDMPRQFADLENAMGRAVMDHGGLYGY